MESSDFPTSENRPSLMHSPAKRPQRLPTTLFARLIPTSALSKSTIPASKSSPISRGSKKLVPATVTFVDIAGLVKGASEGEGLGQPVPHQHPRDRRNHPSRPLLRRKRCDPRLWKSRSNRRHRSDQPRAHLVRSSNGRKHHSKKWKNSSNPKKNSCLFSTHSKKQSPTSIKKIAPHHCQATEEEPTLRSYPFPHKQKSPLRRKRHTKTLSLPWKMISSKKCALMPKKKATAVIPICAKLEEELSQLSPARSPRISQILGLQETGLKRLIKAAFQPSISSPTSPPVKSKPRLADLKGRHAQEAAGKIHTDIQKGFIRAEVVSFNDIVHYKGRVGAREAGKARSEGKEYHCSRWRCDTLFHN